MAKNAPKSLVVNPSIKMSTVDAVSVEMNKSGNAAVVTLRMFCGAAEEKSAEVKDNGKAKTVTWKVAGSIDLDSTFEVNGVECRFVAVKRFGRLSSLEIRPVATATTETADLSW
jgi:hypothetical protein